MYTRASPADILARKSARVGQKSADKSARWTGRARRGRPAVGLVGVRVGPVELKLFRTKVCLVMKRRRPEVFIVSCAAGAKSAIYDCLVVYLTCRRCRQSSCRWCHSQVVNHGVCSVQADSRSVWRTSLHVQSTSVSMWESLTSQMDALLPYSFSFQPPTNTSRNVTGWPSYTY